MSMELDMGITACDLIPLSHVLTVRTFSKNQNCSSIYIAFFGNDKVNLMVSMDILGGHHNTIFSIKRILIIVLTNKKYRW